MRSPLASLAALTVALAATASCGPGPAEPGQLCDVDLARDCWESLGLDGHKVSAVAATPVGLFAGGFFHDGVFRFDSVAGDWLSLGLDHAIVSSILYVPGDTSRVLVGVKPQTEEETDAAVFATEDLGQSWVPWDGGLAQQNGNRLWAYSLAADPGDPKLLFWGGSAPLLRSRDGGRTWEFVDGKATSFANGVNSIVLSPLRDGNVWAGGESAFSNGYVHHSADWGDSWSYSQVNVPLISVLAIDPADAGTLWAGTPGSLISSVDGGATWEARLHKGFGVEALLFLDSGAYVFGIEASEVGTGSHLVAYRSTDRGKHWKALPVPPDVRGALCAAVDARGRILVGTGGDGVWRYTPDQ